MKSKLIDPNGEKTYVLVFDAGDEVSSGLLKFARENKLSAGQITGIGGFREAVLGYFETERKAYKRIPVKQQVEVLSLAGDIALEKGEPKIHAHVVVGTSEGAALGGHLVEAYVRPTLEVIVRESPKHLQRVFDEPSGLALIRL
ncbi:MAG: PPC domain-containing DNA-binding protein [Terriglobia bacterium]